MKRPFQVTLLILLTIPTFLVSACTANSRHTARVGGAAENWSDGGNWSA